MNEDSKLDKDGYYLEPKEVGKCPLCGSVVIRNRPFGSDSCTREGCSYDTS